MGFCPYRADTSPGCYAIVLIRDLAGYAAGLLRHFSDPRPNWLRHWFGTPLFRSAPRLVTPQGCYAIVLIRDPTIVL
ncbi:MAG: hypothetical protein ABR519_06600 [Bacteroidales bacterium]